MAIAGRHLTKNARDVGLLSRTFGTMESRDAFVCNCMCRRYISRGSVMNCSWVIKAAAVLLFVISISEEIQGDRDTSYRKPSVNVVVHVLSGKTNHQKSRGTVWSPARAKISCSVEGARRKHWNFSWTTEYSYGVPLNKGKQSGYKKFGSKYVIHRSTRNHSGEYFCHVYDKTTGRNISGKAILIVKPTPQLIPSSATVVIGERAVLSCKGEPLYLAFWKFKGHQLQNDTFTKITTFPKRTRLEIFPALLNHSGSYECWATSKVVERLVAKPQLTVLSPNSTNVPQLSSDPATAQAITHPTPSVSETSSVSSITTAKFQISTTVPLSTIDSSFIKSPPPLPPRLVQVEVVLFADENEVFVNIAWLEQEIDGTLYKPSCKAGRDGRWSDGLPVAGKGCTYGYALCTNIKKIRKTQTLELVARVLAINSFGSTSSEVIDLQLFLPHQTVRSKPHGNVTILPFAVVRSKSSAFNLTGTQQPCANLNQSPSLSSSQPSSHQTIPISQVSDKDSTTPSLFESHSTLMTSDTNSGRILPSTEMPSKSSTPTIASMISSSGDSDDIGTDLSNSEPSSLYITTNTDRDIQSVPSSSAPFSSVPPSPFSNRIYFAENSSNDKHSIALLAVGVLAVSLAILLSVTVIAILILRRRVRHIDADLLSGISLNKLVFSPDTAKNAKSDQDVYELPNLQNRSLEHPCDRSLLPNSCLQLEVGPDGKDCQEGGLGISVPPGAVSRKQLVTVQFSISKESMPPINTSENWFIFSPVLTLTPHRLEFLTPVSVLFPFTAARGWIMVLLRADCDAVTAPSKWSPVLAIDTDTSQTIFQDSHCNYDMFLSQLKLSHLCKYGWCGRPKHNTQRSEKTMDCSLFAWMDWPRKRCRIVVYFSNRCQDILDDIKRRETGRDNCYSLGDSRTVLIDYKEETSVEIESNHFDIEGERKIVVSAEDLWHVPFDLPARLQFVANLNDSAPPLLAELTAKVNTKTRCDALVATFTRDQQDVPSSQPQRSTSLESVQSCRSSGRGSLHLVSTATECPGNDMIGSGAPDIDLLFSSLQEALGPEYQHPPSFSVQVTVPAQVNSLPNVQVRPSMMLTPAEVVLEDHAHDGEVVPDDVVPGACFLGCERKDWIKIGKMLLGWNEREVLDIFTNPTRMLTQNSDKVETIINKWRERDGSRATIRQLRAAFYTLNKGPDFDQILEQKLKLR